MKYVLFIFILFAISCNKETTCDKLLNQRESVQEIADGIYSGDREIAEKMVCETDSMILKCGCGVTTDNAVKETYLPNTMNAGNQITQWHFWAIKSGAIHCDTLFVHHIVQVP